MKSKLLCETSIDNIPIIAKSRLPEFEKRCTIGAMTEFAPAKLNEGKTTKRNDWKEISMRFTIVAAFRLVRVVKMYAIKMIRSVP